MLEGERLRVKLIKIKVFSFFYLLFNDGVLECGKKTPFPILHNSTIPLLHRVLLGL
jgi:hypothetical protein